MNGKKRLVLVGLLLLGIGFALVTTTLYINGDVTISANEEDFDVKFTRSLIDNEDKTRESISDDGKTITYTTKELQALNDKSVLDFEITNNSSLYDAEVSIECTRGENGDYYQITKEVASTIPAKTVDNGKIEVEKIKMATEDIEEKFTCTLTAKAVERTTKGKRIHPNHIVDTGENCFTNKKAGSCAPGTEIRYMVNDNEEKIFNVLHDDGETMILQDSENTIENILWYSGSGNMSGPLTALEAIEQATAGWENVNTMEYTMGTTVFKDNAFTGCNSTGCTKNRYTLESRSGKARMITIQETSALGCTSVEDSCPLWLTKSSTYWTMSATLSDDYIAWYVHYTGRVGCNSIPLTFGVRAVVEINK